jgi:hypothetical protein
VEIVVDIIKYHFGMLRYGQEVIDVDKKMFVIFFAILMPSQSQPDIGAGKARLEMQFLAKAGGKMVLVGGT